MNRAHPGNGRDEEPGVAMAHPVQRQPSPGRVPPAMPVVGVQPAHADVGQDVILLIPGLAQERDASAFANRAVSPIAAYKVASLDLLAQALMCDSCNHAVSVLCEAGKLAIQLHVQAVRRQACTQHSLGMLLADHEDCTVGRRENNGIGCQVDLAHEFVVLVICDFIIRAG